MTVPYPRPEDATSLDKGFGDGLAGRPPRASDPAYVAGHAAGGMMRRRGIAQSPALPACASFHA